MYAMAVMDFMLPPATDISYSDSDLHDYLDTTLAAVSSSDGPFECPAHERVLTRRPPAPLSGLLRIAIPSEVQKAPVRSTRRDLNAKSFGR
jgi:hypothetical protein